MHAILPNVPRLAAHVAVMVLLAVVVALVAATRLSDVSGDGSAGAARPAASAPALSSRSDGSGELFLRSPLVSPVAHVSPPWVRR